MLARLGPIVLDLLDGWGDVTHGLVRESDAPPTLAKQSEDACGSLQVSFALYHGGPRPDPSPEVLAELLREFGESHGLGDSSDEHMEGEPLRLAAATFRSNEWMVRAWYVSNGASFAKVTYTANADHSYASELAECEHMVRTIRFALAGDAA